VSFFKDMFGNTIEVVGIGTVELPTKISPTKTGPSSHGILRLEKVLHAPSILCNIIGNPILDDYEVLTSFSKSPSGTAGSITNLSDGRPVAYFKPMIRGVRFWEVRLSGPPVGPKVGPSPFDSSVAYVLHALWPDSERQRFAALQASRQTRATASGPLTSAEKAWLKTYYGNEFKFLRDHGLSIFKDEDREEGRTILRAIMSNDDDEPAT
jgi:hypothetical protein